MRYALCASPDYLSRIGLVETLADLKNHEFLQYGLGTTSNIELTDEEVRKHKDRIHAKINATNGEFLVDMVVKGHGITFIQGRYLNTVSISEYNVDI
ncbi:LysR substrate-binding domain-containing protein [Psychrobacter glacincola]|uniref:LysR substrate-binding domain-containing protein n=1 Tax=Psychrobacter glacincola TaxID=56810 RepID=UPI003D033247